MGAIVRNRFYRPEELFAINFNAEMTIKEVGEENHRVLLIDKFYKNPTEIRNMFLNTPAAIWKDAPKTKNFKDYFDCRHSWTLPDGYDHLPDFLSRVVKKYFGDDVFFDSVADTNMFQLVSKQPVNTTAFPHVDYHPSRLANQAVNALVYLNTNRESRGGTALYRHKPTGRESIPLSQRAFDNFNKKYINCEETMETGQNYWCKYQKNWEPFHIIEMKFNRLAIFPSQVFHGAWHEPGWFYKYPRLNQVFFSKAA